LGFRGEDREVVFVFGAEVCFLLLGEAFRYPVEGCGDGEVEGVGEFGFEGGEGLRGGLFDFAADG
jgi:hypothetical protein